MDYERLQKFCSAYGISGDESDVAALIIEEIKDYCDYSIDPLGNVIAFKKGAQTPPKKVMLSAHMDEVGMIVSGFLSDGSLSFVKVGGIDDRVIIGRQVLVGKNRIPGVIGTKATHQQTEEERKTSVSSDKLYIDLGCRDQEEAMKLADYGDPVYFVADYAPFGDGMIKSKAIDDRFGCAVLIDMIRSELPYDTYFVFCVQEEIGLRGSTAAADTVAPDYAIVLEATTAGDLPEVQAPKTACILGKGAVVGFMDRSTIYPRDFYRFCHGLAEERGIAIQTKTMVAGGNDAGAIHKSRGGVKTIAVSAPCRYLHSPYCVVRETDLEAVEQLVWELLQVLATGTAF